MKDSQSSMVNGQWLGRCLAVLVVFATAWAGAIRWVRRVETQQIGRPVLREGIAWSEWLRTSDAAKVDKRLKNALTETFASWANQSAAEESFGILRAHGKRNGSACYPFERQHALGRAADVWVGDLNQDGYANLTDLCLFASTLEKVNGGCGVYEQQLGEGVSALWVHVDVSGKIDRWGERRAMGDDVQPIVWSGQQRLVRDRCKAWGLKPNGKTLKLVVDKQPAAFVFDVKKQAVSVHPSLRLYVGRHLVKSYPVALGFDPVNDKEKRDDYRTPEGDFYICGKNPNSQFHKSLRLSYPNAEDAARGLRDELIDEKTSKRIVRAIRRKRTPPQNTALGGDIMLHGGGGARDPWTWGCVALDNNDIDELFEWLPLGTAVKVLPVR
jgi:hypothetical protein